MFGVFIVLFILAVYFACAWAVRRYIASGSSDAKDELTGKDDFLAYPYLQLGNNPHQSQREQMELVWLTRDVDHLWAVEVRKEGERSWVSELPETRRIVLAGLEPFQRHRAPLKMLAPGKRFEYRLLMDGDVVFLGRAVARKTASQPCRFVVVGDLATGREGARRVAYHMGLSNPDLLVIAGDVCYKRGRVSEYLDRYFPVYNYEVATPYQGAPLLRSTVSVAAFGNHDAGTPELTDVRDLNQFPDLLAYFILWSHPLNGPLGTTGGANTPDLRGARSRQEAFLSAAGESFPRAANYSFDYGSAHWLVIDANNYMDWTDQGLRGWVDKDLAAAKDRVWKFVVFHQSAFTTDRKHQDEQRMRLLADIFERHGVDIVFSGHNHAYERNYPLRFKVKPLPDGSPIDEHGRVNGDLVTDRRYEGRENTRPDGVMYIVTGGGGGKLNLEPDRRADHNRLPPFTSKLVDDTHSFTVCDVDGKTLTVRQISEYGKELDRFVITK